MRIALCDARKKAGLTQEQIADISGIDRTVYNRIERGLRNPDVEVAIKIAGAVNKTVEEIFLMSNVLEQHEMRQSDQQITCLSKTG